MSDNKVEKVASERLADSETGPKSKQLYDQEILAKLKSKFLSYWPSRKNDFFPAPQPVSLQRRDLFRFKKFDYLVCVKSDGMRFVMVCTVVNGMNKCYMVNRAFRYYEVEQCFDQSIYKGTMFDGELVRTGPKRDEWTFIIHDCIVFCGEDITKNNFYERYERVTTAIETFWDFVEKEDSFPINVKKFYEFKDLDKLISDMDNGNINHNTDGLIFTPTTLAVGMHTQYTLFKWKPRERHTFDFKIVDEDDELVAKVNQKGELIVFASISKNSEVGKMFYNKLKSFKEYVDGSIVECDYDEVTECYSPILIRTDKTHPNGIYTVDKTLLNIKENITVDELIKLSKKN